MDRCAILADVVRIISVLAVYKTQNNNTFFFVYKRITFAQSFYDILLIFIDPYKGYFFYMRVSGGVSRVPYGCQHAIRLSKYADKESFANFMQFTGKQSSRGTSFRGYGKP